MVEMREDSVKTITVGELSASNSFTAKKPRTVQELRIMCIYNVSPKMGVGAYMEMGTYSGHYGACITLFTFSYMHTRTWAKNPLVT